MKSTHKAIAKALRLIADNIENGKCGLVDEEMIAIGSLLTNRKMTIEQCAQHYGVSRATFYRWIKEGKMPRPHKEPGGKEYMWLNECEEYLHDHK